MRTFESPSGLKCVVCNTSKEVPCILVGIDGTLDGNNEEATVLHVDCINLRLSYNRKIIYQIIGG